MKELIIIVYKIDVTGLTKEKTTESLKQVIENCSLKNDKELKENYIIKEIFLPIQGKSDIKVIYPVQNSLGLYKILKEMEEKIKDSPDELKNYWNQIVRELKIRKLNDE